METFRLRIRVLHNGGYRLECHILAQESQRLLGASQAPETIAWLQALAAPFLARAAPPVPALTPGGSATLLAEEGMRLALAFSAAQWLRTPQHRRLFRAGLDALPSEVVLYWFTLCFYGYRQAAGRAALRVLFLHEEGE